MKPKIRIAFAYFWPGFTPDTFRSFFPYIYEKYDLVMSSDPEVGFYSIFTPNYYVRRHDPRVTDADVAIQPGNYIRVFFTGENREPMMDQCEYAISFSSLVNHPNHLRLPLWVYENRSWGFPPEALVKRADTDWEKVAREKTEFCNFIYSYSIPFRDALFHEMSRYKRVDAAGPCLNNMNGVTASREPNRVAGKVGFIRRYKFTLALENDIWPGYGTEKLVDPMFAASIPIYFGDPQAKNTFDPANYIDFTSFNSVKETMEFVREVDNNRDLYFKMLAAPFYRGNQVPHFARDENIESFFDKIFEAALARR